MTRAKTLCGLLCAVWLGLGATPASAEIPRSALETIRRVPIQHGGRIKPFDSFARETVKQITGASTIDGEDPVKTLLQIMAEPEPWQAKPLIEVPFRPLREPLGMDPKARHISYTDLVATRKLMRMLPAIVQKQQRDEKLTILENETMDAFGRFVTFSNLVEQRLELVPPCVKSERVWQPILQAEGCAQDVQEKLRVSWNTLMQAVRAGAPEAINTAASHLSQRLFDMSGQALEHAPWRPRLEVWYNRIGFFRIAQIAYLIAAALLLVGLWAGRAPLSAAGLGVLIASALVHVAGIVMRVVLGGRPPVSNFFETMLWLPLVAVMISLVLERLYRVGYIGLSAALVAAITLVLADYVPLDPSITPVVAVLRSNLWLTIHVLTIVASYGALALATMLAHVYGVCYLTGGPRHRALRSLDLVLYRAIQVGVVLLAGGVMLGAVWANASWGRYWGWDPKETWALITLLWFLAVLHGRFAGWIKGIGVAMATIGGFFLLLMTYYGVSFYLVGLHSYAGGNAKPLPTLLVVYLIAEAVFLAVLGGAKGLRKRAGAG